MAQVGDVTASPDGVDVHDQQAAQPSSPTGSNSSRDEKKTREKLKKTSIAGLKQHVTEGESNTPDDGSALLDPSDPAGEAALSNGIRGRPAKKRSFEDLAKDDAAVDAADNSAQPPEPKSGHHKRMRSRDIATGDQVAAYTKVETDKSETVHEETDMDAQFSPGGPGVLVDAPSQEEMEQDETLATTTQSTRSEDLIRPAKSESAKENPKEESSSSKIPPGSGFANASTSSPFGQAKSPPKDDTSKDSEKITSSSAFASSGLSAFASTEKSPFGATSSSKSPLGFGGGGPIGGGFGSSKGGFGSSSGFGGTTTTSSTFGSGGGFGSAKGFGSTFGAPKPFGSTPSAFGTGGPGSGGFGTGKPFTTNVTEKAEQEEDGEEGENDENEDSATKAGAKDVEQDPRFHAQQIDTGEAGEETHFSSRARLYFFSKDGGWKERGIGTFKINVRVDDNSISEEVEADVEAQAESVTGRRKARLLMRADATHRVLLNTPVFRGMQFGAPDGSEPTGKVMHLQSLEESKPVPLQIKIGKEEVLRELYHRLRELEQEA